MTEGRKPDLARKRRHAEGQNAYRSRRRLSGLATLSTEIPSELLQYVTDRRDQAGYRNLGAALAEILSEHRARHSHPQPKDSTVSA